MAGPDQIPISCWIIGDNSFTATVGVPGGGAYAFNFFVDSTSPPNQLQSVIEAYTGTPFGAKSQELRDVPSSVDYFELSMPFTLPAGTTGIRVTVNLFGASP